MSGDRVASGTWKGYEVSGDGLTSGSITTAVTVRRSSGGTQLTYTANWGTTRAKRASTASAAKEARDFGQSPAKIAGWCSGVRARPTAKAVSGGDKLTVTVDPASSVFSWQVAVQRRGSDGRWRTQSTIGLRLRIRGDEWTGYRRTLNLPRGTYRAVVKGVNGFAGGASSSATLTR